MPPSGGSCALMSTVAAGPASGSAKTRSWGAFKRPRRSIGTGGWNISAKRRGSRLIGPGRSEEHTSELQSLMRISYAVFCLKKKKILMNKEQLNEIKHIIMHKEAHYLY